MVQKAIIIAAISVLTVVGLAVLVLNGGLNGSVSGSTTIKVGTAKLGDTVQVDYWLTVDGKLVQTTEGKDPFEFTLGKDAVLKDFETAVIGMKAGDVKEILIPAERGYPKGYMDIGEKPLRFKIKLVKILL